MSVCLDDEEQSNAAIRLLCWCVTCYHSNPPLQCRQVLAACSCHCDVAALRKEYVEVVEVRALYHAATAAAPDAVVVDGDVDDLDTLRCRKYAV